MSKSNIKTAAQLTEAIDATLKAPASAPNTSTHTTEPTSGKDTLLGEVAALLPKRRPPAAPTPTPTPTPTPAPAPAPAAPVVALTEASAVPLTVYEWDPMPTTGDPLGLRERIEYVEAAIAARTAPPSSAASHTPVADPASPLVEARFVEAHRRLIDMLG